MTTAELEELAYNILFNESGNDETAERVKHYYANCLRLLIAAIMASNACRCIRAVGRTSTCSALSNVTQGPICFFWGKHPIIQ